VKVLVVGSGAREHAMAWKIRRDRADTQLFLAPGNPGSGALGERLTVAADDVDGLISFARGKEVDLTLVGPEGPLAAGIGDAFAQAGLALFGPSAAAARIEASKAWAKEFMRRHGIPTAAHRTFAAFDEAAAYIEWLEVPPVVKDDALAGGKGVTVARTHEEALAAARAVFQARPGGRVVLEERMDGWEVSAMAFCDGRTARLMPAACDYKRLRDGDEGPNTGGMGAYAPAAISPRLRDRILREIVQPTLDGMAAEGCPFVGVLYPGLMITPAGPKVVEFNCRFGDPEAEALIPLLRSELLDVVQACLAGRLDRLDPEWSEESCCAVVYASAGYPDSPQPAEPGGLERVRDAVAFRGGSSGRVLTVSAVGATLEEARQKAYAGIRGVDLPGGHYRADIAAYDRALTAEVRS